MIKFSVDLRHCCLGLRISCVSYCTVGWPCRPWCTFLVAGEESGGFEACWPPGAHGQGSHGSMTTGKFMLKCIVLLVLNMEDSRDLNFFNCLNFLYECA
uniref:Uncharacterized protein n=1 Tax=Anguilla anguilla TaxID=7936 RepID=A0A0E9PHI0_ANGAN